MKLLYTVIILEVIQLVTIKPLEASTAFELKIMQFYAHELLVIDKDFCEKAKILCEKVLQDKLVKQAKTSTIKEFKQNITDFLHDYPSYMRYEYINELALLFDAKLPHFNNNKKDLQYIWELLKKHGYDKLDADYQSKFMKFVKQKFLPKFEQLKKQLNKQEFKQQKHLIKWYNELKKCQDYACNSKYFSQLAIGKPTPKETLLQYIRDQLNYINIFYGNTAHKIVKGVLNNKKLSQLSLPLRTNLINSIKNFLMQYKKHQHIDQLHDSVHSFYDKILLKYYYNTKIALKDLNLLRNIFDEQGYAKFVNSYERRLKDFVQRGLSEKFQQFIAALSKKELAKEETFLEWYDHLKGLKSVEEIMAVFERFYDR
ncbi:uncharacterized protein LOC135952462 [Calliphora vicina]|uniref:uncharacterized protein LOC135952462 n=1 Tax=Calliphora vicina TaxID=7373 RepID=UPI00325A931D